MLILLVFGFTITAALLIYIWLIWNRNYWKRRGVQQLEPQLIFGNVKDLIFHKRSKFDVYDEMYKSGAGEPAIGYYEMRQPCLLIREFPLAKQILEDDFDSFCLNVRSHSRLNLVSEFHPNYATSRERVMYLRNIGTSILTSAKLSKIIPHLITCCNHMIEYLTENQNRCFDAGLISGLHSTDSSVMCVYGLHCNSFATPNSVYKQVNEALFSDRPSGMLNNFLDCVSHRFSSTLGTMIKPEVFSDYYTNIVQNAIRYRSKYQYDIELFDFLQSIIDLNEKDENLKYFNVNEITGHSLTILSESFATTSTVLTHVLDMLSKHTKIQSFLRQEIDKKIVSKDDITYEKLQEISYLTAFVYEVIRIRPPIPVIQKICTKNTTIEGKNKKYTLNAGDRITVPILSLQTDSKYFKDPQQFKPERFYKVDEYDIEGFMPFGLGPRECMGRHFAMVQIKTFVIALLKNFKIIRDRSEEKVEYDENHQIYLTLKGKINIKFISLEEEDTEGRDVLL